MMESVVAHLHDRNLLLILDNCEHVLAPAARFATHIVQYSPGVTILVTSRERLGVAGETVVRIPPMTTPPADITELIDVARFDAARLFCERARSSQPQFEMDNTNCATVASICRRLDGIPLAIELAATRLSSLSVVDVDERLDHRFNLLTGGDRAGHARQRTLRATVDWSYDLLSHSEQTVFSQLSVIAGGWSLSAALAVCTADDLDAWALEDHVGSLVDKNLVQTDLVNHGIRYRLLDTIRSYAAEKLAAQGTAEVWAARHRYAEFLVQTVETAAPHLTGADQNWWVTELERDHDNLRAALTFLSEEGAPTELAFRLATGLRWFWFIRGYYDEGIQFLDHVLARADADDEPQLRATALLTAGTLYQPRGEYARAKSALEECRTLALTLGSSVVLADALCEMAWLAFQEGDQDTAVELANEAIDQAQQAEELKLVGFALSVRGGATFARDRIAARKDFDEAIRCLQAAGDHKRLSGILCRLAIHELEIGDLDAARIHLQDVRTIAIELDDEGILPFVHSGLGFCALFRSNDIVAARTFFGDALTVACRVDDQASIAYAILGLAFCATADLHSSAALLHGAADELMSASEQTLEEFETTLRDHDHDELRTRLGAAEFVAAYSAGQRLDGARAVEIALEYARAVDALGPASRGDPQVTTNSGGRVQ
jgi:non-specific serine/threonine protein kinase